MVATSCFKYMGYNTFFHFTIDVLNLKLCFATDVLTERSGSLSEFVVSVIRTLHRSYLNGLALFDMRSVSHVLYTAAVSMV